MSWNWRYLATSKGDRPLKLSRMVTSAPLSTRNSAISVCLDVKKVKKKKKQEGGLVAS